MINPLLLFPDLALKNPEKVVMFLLKLVSGPGATNLVSGHADALLDSLLLVAITGQVPRRMICNDAFQETSIVEVTRSITKHNYLVLDVEDIPRIIKEAFFFANSSRLGLVFIDYPKDIQ
ncbi:unnamed protein product [Amaranthus hypochondriacus]